MNYNTNDIYPLQNCQDAGLTKKFSDFHVKIVEEIISFCHENDIQIDEIYLNADCLKESIKENKWLPSTDSCFRFDNNILNEYNNRENQNETFEDIELKHKPFLISL